MVESLKQSGALVISNAIDVFFQCVRPMTLEEVFGRHLQHDLEMLFLRCIAHRPRKGKPHNPVRSDLFARAVLGRACGGRR